MLGKILKYDFKAQFKSLFPVYLIAFGLSITVRLMGLLVDKFSFLTSVYGFLFAMAIASLIGVVVWSAVVCVKYFYTNMLRDEGYLTNTLPVTRNQLIISKEIMIIITMIMGTVVIAASIFIGFYHGGIQDFFEMINDVMAQGGVNGVWLLLWVLVLVVVSYISFIQMCFTSLMFGQTKNNKIMFAIVFGILIYIARSILSLIMIGIDMWVSPEIMNIVLNDVNPMLSDVYNYVTLIFASTLILTALLMVAMHFISVYLANHKLNLE